VALLTQAILTFLAIFFDVYIGHHPCSAFASPAGEKALCDILLSCSRSPPPLPPRTASRIPFCGTSWRAECPASRSPASPPTLGFRCRHCTTSRLIYAPQKTTSRRWMTGPRSVRVCAAVALFFPSTQGTASADRAHLGWNRNADHRCFPLFARHEVGRR